MKFKKKELMEIIDSNGDLIGKNDIPTSGADLETQANGTTDINAKKGQQPFRYDMLGRFGFTMMPFMEGKESQEQLELIKDLTELMHQRFVDIIGHYYRNPNKLKPDYRKESEGEGSKEHEKYDKEYAMKIMKVVQKHFEDAFDEPKAIDEEVSIKKPLTFKTKNNDQFYITFKFDGEGRLSAVDNKWDVGFPDWWGLDVSQNEIIHYFRNKYPEYYVANNSVNEAKVVEDKIVDKRGEDEISNKSEDKEVTDKKLEKIAGLINKLDKKDIDKLKNLLEAKEPKEENSFTPIQKQKIERFVKNYKGDFEDDDIHKLSERLGLDKHEVEEFIYGIARRELKK
jgi:hypothetical protein